MPIQLDADRLRRTSTLQKIYDRTRLFWVFLITLDLVMQAFRSANNDRERMIFATEIVVTVFLDLEIIIRFAADWRGFHRIFIWYRKAFQSDSGPGRHCTEPRHVAQTARAWPPDSHGTPYNSEDFKHGARRYCGCLGRHFTGRKLGLECASNFVN